MGSEFKAITSTVMDSIAPPIGSGMQKNDGLPRPSLFVHFPSVDEHVSSHIVDLSKFCCGEIFGNAGGDSKDGRLALGGDPVVTSASEWAQGGAIVSGIDAAIVASEVLVEMEN